MNKMTVQVPEGITKLSQWTDFGNYLPSGRFILNKKITGCGATTYFLECPVPVILCSHRIELLECKSESPRHKGLVHLFKSSLDKTSEDLTKNMARLREYLVSCCPNPFGGTGMVPKILVTTDSLRHVIDVLRDEGILNQFTVVSDEMQCIFTDASFKGDSVMNYLNDLECIKDIVFLSATPYLENYLDKLPEFRDLPYIELVWPSSTVEDITVNPYYVKNLYEAAKSRIEFYKTTGYFEENGYYRATQAVFFINSINDILKLIRNCGLTKDEVNIICSSSNDKTLRKLKKLGLRPGHAQLESDAHVTYTFITKCAYEGVDLYHPNAYTYIFSNPNLSNLAMDLSIDLIQILGRQRLDTNPWKTQATIYYQTTKDKFKIPKEEFLAFQAEKDKFTAEMCNSYNTSNHKTSWVENFIAQHSKYFYSKDYVCVVTDQTTGQTRAMSNFLVRLAEERAYDIQNGLYDSKYQVLRSLCDNVTHVVQSKVQELNDYFVNNLDFTKRMSFYCQFRDQHPELTVEIIGAITVPVRYHGYYEKYGTAKMRSVSYRESEFKRFDTVSINDIQDLRARIINEFSSDNRFTNKFIKAKLQEIYDDLGLKKKAKASDLSEIYEVRDTLLQKNGKSVHGLKLISIK